MISYLVEQSIQRS